jgi:Flp pilus assembly pilin Flp
MRQPTGFQHLNVIKQTLRRLFQEESGQDLVEYSLLLVLISMACLSVVDRFGDAVEDGFLKLARMLIGQT